MGRGAKQYLVYIAGFTGAFVGFISRHGRFCGCTENYDAQLLVKPNHKTIFCGASFFGIF